MDQNVRNAIYSAVKKEPFAKGMKIELVELELGYSAVEMIYDPTQLNNIYERAHGGALYALIDEAFETAGQTDGTIAVALNVNVTYVSSPEPGVRLRAEAKNISQTKKTAGLIYASRMKRTT
jgi:acyl-CoA thioesterase